jgi:hypothetical protein
MECANSSQRVLRFKPSRVEGLDPVHEVSVFPDRMELATAQRIVTIRFVDTCFWHRGGWLYRPLARLGCVAGRPNAMDKDWFHAPPDRFVRLYTNPPITVFMPEETKDLPYGETTFFRLQEVIRAGGFNAHDLG